MVEVKFNDSIDDISKTNGKWVFCKHRERNTYEVPGGHRESGEDILSTAKRELMEETGATDFTVKPLYFRLHGQHPGTDFPSEYLFR